MKIAQVAPLFESVPPRLYGGTERVVSWLTEELVAAGHEVTLFASGGSITRARLVTTTHEALRLSNVTSDSVVFHLAMFEDVLAKSRRFDIIHFHTEFLHLPYTRLMRTKHVTTLHGRLDLPEFTCVFRRYADAPLISISDHQRIPMRWAHWCRTVPHGLPKDQFRASFSNGRYLAFLGRISPEKRVDRAIAIASRAQIPLKIAAKVDKPDKEYFQNTISPLLRHPLVEFVGEINDLEKQAFLADAKALLLPIDWPEPFGLCMIEAMACGTPVVAFRAGSVPEIVTHGVSGFVVDGIEAAAEAVSNIDGIDRRGVRKEFEQRFTSERMARDYLQVYAQLLANPDDVKGVAHARTYRADCEQVSG